MKIYCRVTDLGLVPMYDSDYEEKKRLKVGDTVLCDIKKPRNYEFHKKFLLWYVSLTKIFQSICIVP